MNNKFTLDKSIYAMIVFVSLIGIILLLIRSDFMFQYDNLDISTSAPAIEVDTSILESSYDQQSFLVLESPEQSDMANSIIDTLKLLGKKVEIKEIKQLVEIQDGYDGVIIVSENIDDLPNVDTLLSYVESGGSVFFALRPAPGPVLSAMYQQLGMIEVGGFIETEGIELTEPFFKTTHSQTFHSENIKNSSLAVRLSDKATVYAVSSDEVPLLWSTSHGEGMFTFFNGSMLSNPNQQALLIKGIQTMVPYFVYPVMNAKVTALKGFPFPIPEGKHATAKMSNEEYIQQVVWAELQRLEAKYDLNYSASLATSSDSISNQSSSQESMSTIGRELVRMGGEMGIQPDQHKSISGNSEDTILEELQTTADLMEQIVPGYEVSSYISSDSTEPLANINELKAIFPKIMTVLASEQKPSINNENIVVLPTTIEGFQSTVFSDWLVFNELAISGYYSQTLSLSPFIYGEDFDQAKHDLALFQRNMKEDVPWMRGLTISNAAKTVQHYSETKVYEEIENNNITFHLSQFTSPAYFFFYSEQKIKGIENCKITEIGSNLYLIEATQLSFDIRLDG